MEVCQQKDDTVNKLQAAMDGAVEDATRDVNALLKLPMKELLMLLTVSV